MSENRVEGAFREATGRIQDAAGGLAGDAETQFKGKTRQAAGKLQGAYGETMDQARDAAASLGGMIEQQPIAAVVVAVVVGYILGSLLHRR